MRLPNSNCYPLLAMLLLPALASGQTAPQLTITSLTPNSAIAGTQGLTMTVLGTGFCFAGAEGSTVLWNGQALPTQFVSPTQLSAFVAPALLQVGGTALVSVVNPGCFPQGSSNTLQFTITTTLLIQPEVLPDATVGRPYSIRFLPIGGIQPYTWQGLDLPPGFVLDPQTGVLSGTPREPGLVNFRVRVTDGAGQGLIKNYSLNILGAPLEFLITTLPNGNQGETYDQLVAVGGGKPPYRWDALEGGVPGLVLLPDRGRLQGVPSTAGTFRILIQVTDADGARAQRAFTVTIDTPLPLINNSFLPPGSVGAAYEVQFTASRGQAPYTWNIINGAVPGLTLSTAGAYTGIPTQAGTFFITVEVRDSLGVRNSRTFQVNITPPSLTVPPQTLPSGVVGSNYAATLQATGAASVTWTIAEGALPPGLLLDANTGIISGTPTQAGTFGFTARATAAGQTAAQTLSIVITQPLSITTSALPNGRVGETYLQTVAVQGGTSPYRFRVDLGQLPPGLTLDPNTGRIAGVPSQAGAFAFTVRVDDANNVSASRALSINVNAAISIQPATLPNGVVGTAYSATLTTSGGTPPVAWSATGLPPGLAINGATGAISGTPTAAGVFNIAVTARDSTNATAVQNYTVTITLPPAPTISYGATPETGNSNTQIPFGITSSAPYPVDITGAARLEFSPVSGAVDDPMIQFTSGGRTANFRIPAGQTTGTITGNPSIMTGTTAGTIRVVIENLNAGGPINAPAPRVITIATAAPVITRVELIRNPTSIDVRVTGFSNTRQLDRGLFRFSVRAGDTLQTSDFTVQLNQAFATWYGNSQSNQFGTQFVLTMPFSVSGDVNAITGVSVTLTNSRGDSTAVNSQ